MFRPRLIAFVLSGALATAAAAQDVLLYRAGETPDARDVARILGGKPAAAAPGDEEPVRTRSLRDADGPATRGFKLVQPAPRPDAVARAERIARPATGKVVRPGPAVARNDDATPTALALGVQFAFDSAEILPPARSALDALAEGIKLLGPDQRVLIEGHTDATGSDDYNLGLSQRRATSVKQYLISVHGIDGTRLEAVGLGKTRPLYAADPFAPENRRVQFQGG